MNLQEADRALLRCESFFTVLPETPTIYPEWRRLVRTFGVSGLKVHDARLVASRNVHGVKHVLTFDVEDFRRYAGITVHHPAEVGP
jgi:predicted nucleic acid-binding protein